MGAAHAAGSVAVAVLDFNHDGWMDLAFTHDAAPGLTLWRNNKAKTFERVDLPNTDWVRAFGVAAFDYDNDGWVDLVAVGETKDGKGEVRLFRNLGPEDGKTSQPTLASTRLTQRSARHHHRRLRQRWRSRSTHHTESWPRRSSPERRRQQEQLAAPELKGLNDNKSAIGTKVEVFSGANRQKFEIYGSSGYLGQNSPYLTVGLGQAKQADIVRMLWPTGVLQDEIEIAGNKVQDISRSTGAAVRVRRSLSGMAPL